jgi:hypothetical protein
MAKKRSKPEPKFIPADGARSLEWSDADIDRLADVTPEDVASGKAFWRAKAGGPMKRLLDAKPRKRKT